MPPGTRDVPRRGIASDDSTDTTIPARGRRVLPDDEPVLVGRRGLGFRSSDDDPTTHDAQAAPEAWPGRRAWIEAEPSLPPPIGRRFWTEPTTDVAPRRAVRPVEASAPLPPPTAVPVVSDLRTSPAWPDAHPVAAGTGPRRAAPPTRRRSGLPIAAVATVLVVALLATVAHLLGRSTATAIDPPGTAVASVVPRVVTVAPGPGRPAELKAWLQSTGFECTAEDTSEIEGYLCLLSGPNQTTAYVGGGASGLGRVTMMTPYDPSAISREVQDRLLAAALGSEQSVAAAKAGLANGTLEKPASISQGGLTIRGSLGRQLTVTTDGWPGLTVPRFGLSAADFPAVSERAGYTCVPQTGVVECTRSIGQMQLSLSAFTGVEDLRYVRIRVTGPDRTVVQQAVVSEAALVLPQIGGALDEAFRRQAAAGAAVAFAGSYLLDYYPPTTSGNTVRVTLYVSQTCWTGTALTC